MHKTTRIEIWKDGQVYLHTDSCSLSATARAAAESLQQTFHDVDVRLTEGECQHDLDDSATVDDLRGFLNEARARITELENEPPLPIKTPSFPAFEVINTLISLGNYVADRRAAKAMAAERK